MIKSGLILVSSISLVNMTFCRAAGCRRQVVNGRPDAAYPCKLYVL